MGGQIPVFRGGGSKNDDSLRLAHEFLRAGHTINIFPEGTLTREPNLWPMRGKSGAVRLALETDVPVYAIAHWGAEKILPRYGSKFRPGFWKKVDIIVGDEIDLSPYRGHHLNAAELTEATELVMTKITELVEQLRGEKAPAVRYNPAHSGQTVTGNFVKAEKTAAANAAKSAAAKAKAAWTDPVAIRPTKTISVGYIKVANGRSPCCSVILSLHHRKDPRGEFHGQFDLDYKRNFSIACK